MTYLVIAGAYYYVNNCDMIVSPHRTGEYSMVDCNRYLTKKEIKERYPENWIKENNIEPIEYDGVKYYYAEYAPISITDDWDLLSDLSELFYHEDSYDF